MGLKRKSLIVLLFLALMVFTSWLCTQEQTIPTSTSYNKINIEEKAKSLRHYLEILKNKQQEGKPQLSEDKVKVLKNKATTKLWRGNRINIKSSGFIDELRKKVERRNVRLLAPIKVKTIPISIALSEPRSVRQLQSSLPRALQIGKKPNNPKQEREARIMDILNALIKLAKENINSNKTNSSADINLAGEIRHLIKEYERLNSEVEGVLRKHPCNAEGKLPPNTPPPPPIDCSVISEDRYWCKLLCSDYTQIQAKIDELKDMKWWKSSARKRVKEIIDFKKRITDIISMAMNDKGKYDDILKILVSKLSVISRIARDEEPYDTLSEEERRKLYLLLSNEIADLKKKLPRSIAESKHYLVPNFKPRTGLRRTTSAYSIDVDRRRMIDRIKGLFNTIMSELEDYFMLWVERGNSAREVVTSLFLGEENLKLAVSENRCYGAYESIDRDFLEGLDLKLTTQPITEVFFKVDEKEKMQRCPQIYYTMSEMLNKEAKGAVVSSLPQQVGKFQECFTYAVVNYPKRILSKYEKVLRKIKEMNLLGESGSTCLDCKDCLLFLAKVLRNFITDFLGQYIQGATDRMREIEKEVFASKREYDSYISKLKNKSVYSFLYQFLLVFINLVDEMESRFGSVVKRLILEANPDWGRFVKNKRNINDILDFWCPARCTPGLKSTGTYLIELQKLIDAIACAYRDYNSLEEVLLKVTTKEWKTDIKRNIIFHRLSKYYGYKRNEIMEILDLGKEDLIRVKNGVMLVYHDIIRPLEAIKCLWKSGATQSCIGNWYMKKIKDSLISAIPFIISFPKDWSLYRVLNEGVSQPGYGIPICNPTDPNDIEKQQSSFPAASTEQIIEGLNGSAENYLQLKLFEGYFKKTVVNKKDVWDEIKKGSGWDYGYLFSQNRNNEVCSDIIDEGRKALRKMICKWLMKFKRIVLEEGKENFVAREGRVDEIISVGSDREYELKSKDYKFCEVVGEKGLCEPTGDGKECVLSSTIGGKKIMITSGALKLIEEGDIDVSNSWLPKTEPIPPETPAQPQPPPPGRTSEPEDVGAM